MKSQTENIPIPQHFTPYSLKQPWIMDPDEDSKNIQCLTPNYENFGFDTLDKFDFPHFCGAGFINLRYLEPNSKNSTNVID